MKKRRELGEGGERASRQGREKSKIYIKTRARALVVPCGLVMHVRRKMLTGLVTLVREKEVFVIYRRAGK